MRLAPLLLLGTVLCALCIGHAKCTPSDFVDETVDFVEKEWAKFKSLAKRVYPSLWEEAKRFKIFVSNLRRIVEHQSAFKNGTTTFQQDVNTFADMTNEEFCAQRNGFNQSEYEAIYGKQQDTKKSRTRRDLSSWWSNSFPSISDFSGFGGFSDFPSSWNLPSSSSSSSNYSPPRRQPRKPAASSGSSSVPSGMPQSFSWVPKGAVSPVIDQGSCGGCWAIATAEALEGLYFQKTGKMVPLSPQQLLDCSHDGGNDGCNGGVLQSALKYVTQAGGLVSAQDYPYMADEGRCQQRRLTNPLQTVSGMQPVANGDAGALIKLLVTKGPVMVAIDGSQSAFQFYNGGVYADRKCQPGVANHAVLLVGYGTDSATGLDYWLVKNSWGTDWGEKGYVRIARDSQYGDCCVSCYGLYASA